MTAWRLYCSDGRRDYEFGSDDGTWGEAPSGDVQVLVWWTKDGATFAYGQDEPYRLPGRKSVKHGRTIADRRYERIRRRAYREAGV